MFKVNSFPIDFINRDDQGVDEWLELEKKSVNDSIDFRTNIDRVS